MLGYVFSTVHVNVLVTCPINKNTLDRFSPQCRKVIGKTRLKNSRHFFCPIRSKRNSNSDSLVHVFPRLASDTCMKFDEF